MKSVREVARGLDVLVATPGRLLDLVDQRAVDLSRLEILVLDEADQMLDLGFIHALKRIVQLVPKTRQTLFFSATMPKAIKQLADSYLTNRRSHPGPRRRADHQVPSSIIRKGALRPVLQKEGSSARSC
jgi:superfamily II DNA/RNA helicase